MLGGDGPAALAEAGSPGAFAAKARDHALKDLQVAAASSRCFAMSASRVSGLVKSSMALASAWVRVKGEPDQWTLSGCMSCCCSAARATSGSA
jgi:hypothetical protein